MIPVVCALPDRPASLVRAAAPELPPMALYQGIYGVVRVRVELDRTGAIRNAVIVTTPSRVLVPESLRAARASAFAPARRRCANVASSYEFRVLYAADGPRTSPLPVPPPTPSPSPLPKPDLARPWTLSWSTGGTYSYLDRTVSSSRKYAQVYDTFPISHRAECRGMLSASELDRVVAALRAARPETWRGDYYRLLSDPTPAPSPTGTPASRADVDVVAMVREIGFGSIVMDAPTGGVKLVTGGITYGVGYDFGAFPSTRETVPAEIAELTRALSAATPQRCARRISERAVFDVSLDAE
jgi:hypothetical protein